MRFRLISVGLTKHGSLFKDTHVTAKDPPKHNNPLFNKTLFDILICYINH